MRTEEVNDTRSVAARSTMTISKLVDLAQIDLLNVKIMLVAHIIEAAVDRWAVTA
jgi:hypothetical protein